MAEIKTSILDLAKISRLAWLASFGIALVIMPLFHNQMITGPMVNAVFFISLYFLSLRDALVLAVFPSLIAVSAGTLPPPLAPMLPYIIVSNFILIIIFNFLRAKNYWIGVFLASTAKFLFLYASIYYFVGFFARAALPAAIANMMSWPQLYTALAGGVIAYIFLKTIKRI